MRSNFQKTEKDVAFINDQIDISKLIDKALEIRKAEAVDLSEDELN